MSWRIKRIIYQYSVNRIIYLLIHFRHVQINEWIIRSFIRWKINLRKTNVRYEISARWKIFGRLRKIITFSNLYYGSHSHVIVSSNVTMKYPDACCGITKVKKKINKFVKITNISLRQKKNSYTSAEIFTPRSISYVNWKISFFLLNYHRRILLFQSRWMSSTKGFKNFPATSPTAVLVEILLVPQNEINRT